MILTSPRVSKLWIAAPDWPSDHFGSAVAQLSCDFGKKAVVLHHKSDLAKLRVENGIVRTWRNASLDFPVRQTNLAILADQLTIRTDQNRRVVHKMFIAFVQTENNVQIVLLRRLSEVVRRRPRNWFSGFKRHGFVADPDRWNSFSKYYEVCFLFGCFAD